MSLAACGDKTTVPDASPDAPTAAELLSTIVACNSVVGEDFRPDSGAAATIDICATPGAMFWTADLDIDCNGKTSAQCNLQTDPTYVNQTTATAAGGEPLDAAVVPYVVLPMPSMRFDYRGKGLAMGSVIAVIYADRVEYGVAGDTGPSDLIGEASYAMAELLGIDPNPVTGGVPSGVAYIAFIGADAKVAVVEDHAEAVRIGVARARALVSSQ